MNNPDEDAPDQREHAAVGGEGGGGQGFPAHAWFSLRSHTLGNRRERLLSIPASREATVSPASLQRLTGDIDNVVK